MTTYLYPQNLKATANLWLWSLRDFAILCVAALLSVLALVRLHFMVPAAVTLCFGFLTIRMDDTTVLDFLKYAVRYFISSQQVFEWRAGYACTQFAHQGDIRRRPWCLRLKQIINARCNLYVQ